MARSPHGKAYRFMAFLRADGVRWFDMGFFVCWRPGVVGTEVSVSCGQRGMVSHVLPYLFPEV